MHQAFDNLLIDWQQNYKLLNYGRTTLSYHRDAIAPHGGQLINRVASPEQKEFFLAKAEFLPRVILDERGLFRT